MLQFILLQIVVAQISRRLGTKAGKEPGS
jgi:hypothetical protein